MSGSPIDRLRDVVVTLRSELRVTRSVFRNEPCYILRDPITFSANRFPPGEYGVLMELDGKRTLSEIFTDLVNEEIVSEGDEEGFYGFILKLHRSGLLNLPVSDDASLYERFKAKQSAATKQKLFGFLFLQVSLFSPDAFLNRTVRYVRWLFTRGAFFAWAALMSLAALVAISRWGELTAPLLTLLDNGNLPWLALLLIVLKLFHEAGHAYACKAFGGQVPDVGAIFIVFAPCAYVDASAAWGFPSKIKRLVVSLAGMYVESIFAAIALFVWAATEPSFLNSLAYQTLMMASLVTVLFNLNPLMRFDGYYVLSDLVEISNLRARCSGYVVRAFDRWILGLPVAPDNETPGMRAFLMGFGIASTIYKVTLVLGICGVIMSKVYFLGFALAGYYLGSSLFGFTKKCWVRLASPELAHVRRRSIGFGATTAVVVLLGGICVPISPPVIAKGVLRPEVESFVRARSAGFLADVGVRSGDQVSPSTIVATLENREIEEHAQLARLRWISAETEERSAVVHDPAQALRSARTADYLRDFHRDAERTRQDLVVHAESSGRVLSIEEPHARGRFVREGAELARIGSGRWVVELLLDEATYLASEIEVGSSLGCRLESQITRVRPAVVLDVAKAGSRTIEDASLTSVGGGDIVVDPTSGEADVVHFRVTVALEPEQDDVVLDGQTVLARIPSRSSTVFLQLYRRSLRFLHALRLT